MVSFSEFKNQRVMELWNEKRYTTECDQIPGFSLMWEEFQIPPSSMIEIGCFKGISTEFWLLHCASVIALDPWDGYNPNPQYGEVRVFEEFMERCGAYPNLTVRRDKSPNALFKLPKVDFIYIDGDHSEHAVRNDVEAAFWRTNRPGWIGGHDYNLPGVERVVNDLGVELQVRIFPGKSWLVELI